MRERGSKGRRPNQKPNPTKSNRQWRNQYGSGETDGARKIGEQYTTASYRRAIHYACDKAGVAKWGPHRLRHNAATFLRREFGLEVASIILGHSSLAITQTYAEQNNKKAMEVMAQVG